MPVMNAAGGWYLSGTFWAAAGVVVAVLAAVAVVWVTLAVGFPRRRLYFGLRASAPLLAAPAGIRGDLELRHRGTALADPRVVTVELVSRGRRDIPSEAFDSGQPLVLDIGARIVEVLQVTSGPGILPGPRITAEGAALKVGPSLIGRRQEITISVLTDDGEPSLACHGPLIDVQVRQRAEGLPAAPVKATVVAAAGTRGAVAAVGAVVTVVAARAMGAAPATVVVAMVVVAGAAVVAAVVVAGAAVGN